MIKLLYTTEQIAEMYGGEDKNVTPYMITHTWVQKGLKHIKGKGSSFLYKTEWVDEYLEEQAEMCTVQRLDNVQGLSRKKSSKSPKKSNLKCFVS